VIAGPRHFTALAQRLRWDPDALDLEPDARTWPLLPARRRGRLAVLVAGFVVAETSVATELAPFLPRAGDDATRAAFAAQRADEERHARVFERIAGEVVRLGGPAAARAVVPAPLRELFEQRLPATAAAVADGGASLEEGVGLYHMVIEGLVLTAGQHALLDDLADGALPGVLSAVELVERDERWHVGFGLRCLLDLRPGPDLVAALAGTGESGLDAWGEAVPAEVRRRVEAQHRRRLAAVGLAGHATAGSLA
jgi:ribonucleoside-diphosphate reductase beta chain